MCTSNRPLMFNDLVSDFAQNPNKVGECWKWVALTPKGSLVSPLKRYIWTPGWNKATGRVFPNNPAENWFTLGRGAFHGFKTPEILVRELWLKHNRHGYRSFPVRFEYDPEDLVGVAPKQIATTHLWLDPNEILLVKEAAGLTVSDRTLRSWERAAELTIGSQS